MSVVVFNSVVNYGQFVCYKKRPTSRANNSESAHIKLPYAPAIPQARFLRVRECLDYPQFLRIRTRSCTLILPSEN